MILSEREDALPYPIMLIAAIVGIVAVFVTIQAIHQIYNVISNQIRAIYRA